MNRGFTKLEIILTGIVLLFLVGFLSTKNLNLFISKESLLRQRYNKYVSLLDDKNYSEAYNLYSSSFKNERSHEDFINSAKKSTDIGRQKVTINKIVIKNNIGFIVRNNTVCVDSNCTTTKELRGYKRWVLENGNWYYSPPDPLCIREEMFDMSPEFKRALSLINQRFSSWFKKNGLENPNDISFFNCVNIQYSDTADAEGIFTFDENNSNIENLHIYVNPSYMSSDDLLTAFLLTHETKHALNYLNKVTLGNSIGCIDDEVGAFYNQLLLTGLITPEEGNSLDARLKKDYRNPSNQLKIYWDLLVLRDQAEQICGTNQFDDCTMKEVVPLIEKMVKSNPYYQKQCGLN